MLVETPGAAPVVWVWGAVGAKPLYHDAIWEDGGRRLHGHSEQIYILERHHVIAGNSSPSPLSNILDEEALTVHSSLERRVCNCGKDLALLPKNGQTLQILTPSREVREW